MPSERLTEKALQQHDKEYPKVNLPKIKTLSQSKEDQPGSVKTRLRQLSRSESRKSIATTHDPSCYWKRQLSKSSSDTLYPRAGLSVFRVVHAARTWKRLSDRNQIISEKPKILLENTYRLDPDPEQVFRPDRVQLSIQETLSKFLRNFIYTSEQSKRMCLNISSEIKSRVKSMNFPRYKIVTNVIIMQNKGQSSDISSRCVWTPTIDSFASYTFKTEEIICVANVFAVYFE